MRETLEKIIRVPDGYAYRYKSTDVDGLVAELRREIEYDSALDGLVHLFPIINRFTLPLSNVVSEFLIHIETALGGPKFSPRDFLRSLHGGKDNGD